MANKTVINEEVLEGTTPVLTAKVTDEDGTTPISGESLQTLTLTFYSLNDASYPIINNRDGQNVLNQNDVTVDGSGNLTWNLQAADTAILDDTLGMETHRGVFKWTYLKNGEPKVGRYLIDIKVENLERVS